MNDGDRIDLELLEIVNGANGLTEREVHAESEQSPDLYLTKLSLQRLVARGRIKREAFRYYAAGSQGLRQTRPALTSAKIERTVRTAPVEETVKLETRILKLLPVRRHGLAEQLGAKKADVNAAIEALRKSGELTSTGIARGVMLVPTDVAAGGKKPPAKSPVTGSNVGDAVEAILRKAVDDAQAAVDNYVAEVCNPKVLGPLRAHRDGARAALREHVEGRTKLDGGVSR